MEPKTRLINYRKVENMIGEYIKTLKLLESEGKTEITIGTAICYFEIFKDDLNKEWHREIEELFIA